MHLTSTTTAGCTAGYFKSTDGTTCTSCGGYNAPAGSVATCTSATVIATCASGYNLVNAYCYPTTTMSATLSAYLGATPTAY